MCIATCSDSNEEYDYYHTLFEQKVSVIDYDRSAFSTYKAMDSSSVIISFSSTAAIEAYGWGKKVLFCNYSGNPGLSMSIPEICCTDIPEYDSFRNRLQTLIEMDDAEYDRQTVKNRRYYMNYDPDEPVPSYLRNLIYDQISKSGNGSKNQKMDAR